MEYRNVKTDVSSYNKWGFIHKPFQSIKLEVMQEMSMQMQREAETSSISVVFRGQKITFPPISFDGKYAPVVKSETNSLHVYGQFDTEKNEIEINPRILPSAHMSCESTAHETAHKIQDGLKSLKPTYEPGSIEHDYLEILERSNPRYNDTYNRFGIEFTGTAYIRGNMVGITVIDDVATSFYPLSVVERHAFLTADKIMNEISTPDDIKKSTVIGPTHGMEQISKSIKDIQVHYGCEHLSVAEMLQVMDRVQTFIILGYGLETNLDANIAYDMAAILEHQNRDDANRKLDLAKRLNRDEKARVLYESGFQIIGHDEYKCAQYIIFNNMPVNSIEHIDQLTQMSEYDQVNNPIAIINFAFENDINIIPYLKCPEAFNAWVFSEKYLQQVPEFIRNELGNLLGETYSNDNITRVINENQNRKEEIKADDICMQLIDNDCGYVFERD